jgi:hypothetical protein
MKKRSVTGWRQVPPAAIRPMHKSSPSRISAAVPAAPAAAEPPPKAQWETEGGTVAAATQPVNKKKD